MPVVIGVLIAVFFLIRLIPGDPAAVMLGDSASDEAVAELREELGLNLPLAAQFWQFLVTLFSTGSVGNSIFYDVPTSQLISDRAGLTFTLVILASLITLLIVVPLALIAASNRNRWPDHLIRVLPAAGMAMPTIWVGLLLILIFAVNLSWLPAGGGEGVRSLILPAVTVAIATSSLLIRSLRAEMLKVLDADFVLSYRAAGLSNTRILWTHVLRNAALPTLTLFGLNVAAAIGGGLVIEKVFALNGLGSLMFEAISNRDFPLVQAVALYCAIAVVVVTVLTDLLVNILDPRTREVKR